MRNILYIIMCILFLSCNPKVIEKIDKGDVMVNTMKGKYSYAQFDSMCVADTLPRNLGYWHFLELKSYEDNQRVALFMLIKKDGTVYRVEETMDDSVKIIKRKIIMLEE